VPRGPNDETRPADVIGNAVHAMRMATGQMEADLGKAPQLAAGGRKGARVRASRRTPEQTSDKARIAAEARWQKQQRERAYACTRTRRSAIRFRGHTGNHVLSVSLTAADHSGLQAQDLLLERQTPAHDVGGRRRGSLYVYTLTRQAG
jgi:hypothetical protein